MDNHCSSGSNGDDLLLNNKNNNVDLDDADDNNIMNASLILHMALQKMDNIIASK